MLLLLLAKVEEVMEESCESLFSSSANDEDISKSSVDLLLMDWMDFSSTCMMPLLLLLEVFLLR